MKRKLIREICRKKYYGIITAVSTGLFIIFSLVCICGLCMSRMDVPDAAIYAVTCFILSMGGYASGVSLGKNKRRKGILCGAVCGLWLLGIVSVFGIIAVRGFSFGAFLKNSIFLCIPSVFGGIHGVNSKIKHVPY